MKKSSAYPAYNFILSTLQDKILKHKNIKMMI